MKKEFELIINDINKNKKFLELKSELHHGINRYEHSMRVAKVTYIIADFFKMKNIKETTRAALLHDFYTDLDLSGDSSIKRLKTHPSMALVNSLKYFKLSELQKDIIVTHMFPTTINIPHYKESWLVSLIDKIVSTYEMLRYKISLNMGTYFLFFVELIKLAE